MFKQGVFLEVGAGIVIGKVSALSWACHMNTAPFTQPSIYQENTGAIGLGLEGILAFNIPFSHLTITDLKMESDTVYISGIKVKRRTGETITAEAGTIVTEYLILGSIGGIIFHNYSHYSIAPKYI